MTITERIESGCIADRYIMGWREATVAELESDYPFLKGYVGRLNWKGDDNSKVAILKSTTEFDTYELRLFTEKRTYYITVYPESITVGFNNRYHRPLEDWTRGGDIPDGECNEETFKSILYHILSLELIDYDDGTSKPYQAEEDDIKTNNEEK